MSEKYFNLKKQLEQLGYTKHLPVDAVPLVECLTADLLQTTRSLQHYMETAQDALHQRQDLLLQAEPYKADNAKLVKENNILNKQLITINEEHERVLKETMRKIKSLSDEIVNKDEILNKLRQQCKEQGLRGLCSGTMSSRSKTKSGDAKQPARKECTCSARDNVALENKILEMKKEIENLKKCNESYSDEIALLHNKVENREVEIKRLHLLLEGGRPLSAVVRDCSDVDLSCKITSMYNEFKELEKENSNLVKQLEQSIEKQHEAMLRALNLADKNKLLEEELSKLDKLALTVEDECNNQIKTKCSENILLQEQITDLLGQNKKLKMELTERRTESIEKLEQSVTDIQKIKDYLNTALKEKDEFCNQVKVLQTLNNSLEQKLTCALTQVDKIRSESSQHMVSQLATKDDLINLMEKEKKDYESYSLILQKRMEQALEHFNKNINDMQQTSKASSCSEFFGELYRKISEYERKVLELQNENERLKAGSKNFSAIKKNYLEEKISQLTSENANLTKQIMSLSSCLSHRNQTTPVTDETRKEKSKSTHRLTNEIENLTDKINYLQKEKNVYTSEYKTAIQEIDHLKQDLTIKQSQLEQLEEENYSYRITSRSGRASVDHLKDECNFLREQMLKMQSEMIKEKTMASQLKNVHSDMQKSTHELQEELQKARKQLTILKDDYALLECKCKDLQSEILSLRIEKSKLLDDMRNIDRERDNIVIELDRRTDAISQLEQELNSKSFTIQKLESEIAEIKQRNYSISENKMRENETKIQFLQSEVERLTQFYDKAIMENKHLQNSLTNSNAALNVTKTELEKSQKDANGLRLQLQHYVTEIKRIEDLLSHKEAERSDMLENFASLSVEANILENTNHSLESETASKSLQLQTLVNKVEELEEKLLEKEKTINCQSARIASVSCKASSLENEIKLITEEKAILEKNNTYLKELCNKLEFEKKTIGQGLENTDSELQLYENKIKKLAETRAQLEFENGQVKADIKSMENLLSTARREIIELKLALQDATSETKILKEQIDKLNAEVNRKQDVRHPVTVDPTSSILEMEEEQQLRVISNEDLDFRESRTSTESRSVRYLHGSTM